MITIKIKRLLPLVLPAILLASCGGREERRQESDIAGEMGRRQALELAEALPDTLRAEILIIDVRAREAELRRRGAGKVADSYINAFLHTLDSVSPSLAAELRQ